MGLLDVYADMQKEAEAQELQQVRVNELVKFASVAEELLSNEYGDDYDQDDVIKLAEYLIDNEIEEAEEQEKVAELHEMGAVIARSFIDELSE